MSFPKTGNQMGSFGPIRKNLNFPLLSADSRYFRTVALKMSHLAKNNLDCYFASKTLNNMFY